MFKRTLASLITAAIVALVASTHAQADKVTSDLIQDLDADVNVATTGSTVNSWAPVTTGDTVATSAGAPQLNTGALNGNNTISFTADQMNGSDTSLFDFGTGEISWYAVVNYSSTSLNRRNVFGTLENGSGFDGIELESLTGVGRMNGTFRTNGGADTDVIELNDTRDSWRIYSGIRRGNTLEFYVDGVLQTSVVNGTSITSDALAVGAERTGGGERANFDVAYLAFYDSALSSGYNGQMQEMGAYLEQRYGLDTAYNSSAETPFHTDFTEESFADIGLSQDLPSGTAASITLDTANDRLVLTANASTNMWTSRANAPIVYLDSPDAGFWYVEAEVEYGTSQTGKVAGITVYDGDGTIPDFGFGLDNWAGAASGAIRLQGHGDNDPNVAFATSDQRVTLRLEVFEGIGVGGADRYMAYYDLGDGAGFEFLTFYDSFTSNARAAMYLKTSAGGRDAYFHSFTVGVPAPAALPAGLAMLGLVAARRRRRNRA